MNPTAILGKLPMEAGATHPFRIPVSVVPAGATGVLVLAWAGITGENPGGASFWHLSVTIPGGGENFFSLLAKTAPGGGMNSQAFWLPMPSDAMIRATLLGADLPAPGHDGEVEIHGYVPA